MRHCTWSFSLSLKSQLVNLSIATIVRPPRALSWVDRAAHLSITPRIERPLVSCLFRPSRICGFFSACMFSSRVSVYHVMCVCMSFTCYVTLKRRPRAAVPVWALSESELHTHSAPVRGGTGSSRPRASEKCCALRAAPILILKKQVVFVGLVLVVLQYTMSSIMLQCWIAFCYSVTIT